MTSQNKIFSFFSVLKYIYRWLQRHIIAIIVTLILSWSLISVYIGFYRTGFIHHQIYKKLSLADENRLLQYRFNLPFGSRNATWHCHANMYDLPKDLNTSKLNEIATRYDNEKQEYPSRCFESPIWNLQTPPFKEKPLFINLTYVGNESGHVHWDILVKGDTQNAPLVRSVSKEIWQMNDDKRQFVMIDKNSNTVKIIESYWECGLFYCN